MNNINNIITARDYYQSGLNYRVNPNDHADLLFYIRSHIIICNIFKITYYTQYEKIYFIIFIILLQIVHEVNTQAPPPSGPPAGGPPAGGLPTPPAGGPTPPAGGPPAGGPTPPAGGPPAGGPTPPAGGAKATPAGDTPSGGAPSTTGFANLPSRSATPVGSTPSTQSTISASSDTTTTTPLANLILGAIVGGLVSGLILIFLACLGFFLMRKYARKNEAIAIPELNNNVNRNTPVISNQRQEITPNLSNYNNQKGKTCELGNNSTNNELIQIKEGSFIIDDKVIERMANAVEQKLLESAEGIAKKAMESLAKKYNSVEDDSSGSKNDNR
ncbi:hypothetical protein C1646_794355 [Rhizophagus diaphanus]|nr:hypothetical protein C1646_794355 [Rhizophagus diaphanus] [Rhizophagus sp. MUCL 43196]